MRIFDLSTKIFCALLVAAVSFLSLGVLTPTSSFFHVEPYTALIIGKYLCYAILALSIDLVWGYLGILSLGHGAFFALGGYAFGMYLMRQIGAKSVYAASDLPDFMIFIGWDKLPWYWLGSHSFWFSCLLVLLAPGLLGLAFGWTAFRSRVSGVYFSIISQALTYALMLAFYLNNLGFGGNNGFTDFKTILGFDLRSNNMIGALLAISGLVLLLSYLLCRYLAVSRLGLVLVAIRDNEPRVPFAGYRVETVKLFIFTLSAMMAGLAGALYLPQVGIINPSLFAPVFSVEMVVCVALGGRGTLYGAVFGAIMVNLCKSTLTSAYPMAWPFVLGGLFVAVAVFLPQGLAGLFFPQGESKLKRAWSSLFGLKSPSPDLDLDWEPDDQELDDEAEPSSNHLSKASLAGPKAGRA
ncbi:MAG: urea ABC transporter permease subunit UrtC [Deltaproteobacteria bacterium]|jgi:urea transport system permease protein|nr:urea ABC transporter permease subunit UrtC [Deltaproteobacteria bacterium]